MKTASPYRGLPDRQFWKKDPGIYDCALFDPVGEVPFQLSESDRIVTAGSCFAQHVARYLKQSGYNYFVTEKAYPAFTEQLATKHNYGVFTARYGNLYTARQLKQLLLRAHGAFEPVELSWPSRNGRVVDPFRPQIQPGGFASDIELKADRRQHFEAIRRAVREMDVFVFTLGLTEGWEDRRDNAVFPISPGVAGGVYDPAIYAFRNFSLTETADDLAFSLDYIRQINPGVRFILTVSPVPLNATYEDRHVFLSTTWSKAVLRVAAEDMLRRFENCVYFPSYEVITAPHVRGSYYAEDCREVTEKGVNHVMELFFKHFTRKSLPVKLGAAVTAPTRDDVDETISHLREMQTVIEVLCDEAAIEN